MFDISPHNIVLKAGFFFSLSLEKRKGVWGLSELEFEFEAISLTLVEMINHETHGVGWLKGLKGAILRPSATVIAKSICYLENTYKMFRYG